MRRSLGLRRGMSAVAVAATVLAVCAPATSGHAADDGGLGAFFREQFGIGAAPSRVGPDDGFPDDHPIVVRPRHVVRRPAAKIAVGPVAPVSIYDDTTLRPGDAVMTKAGLRIFLGGHRAPYSEADFAALSDAEGLPKQVEKALLVINKAPRG